MEQLFHHPLPISSNPPSLSQGDVWVIRCETDTCIFPLFCNIVMGIGKGNLGEESGDPDLLVYFHDYKDRLKG